jgi:hypothetical protein
MATVRTKGTRASEGTLAQAASPAPSDGLTERSVFHEPWWLDIATGGEWEVAVVERGGELLGEMPYAVTRRGIWRVSPQPPLTRTLGPVIKPARNTPIHDWRRRLGITSELIAQLPDCAYVQQILDPRVSEAIAFSLRGFAVSASYTLRITQDRTDGDIWTGMRAKTRNSIRRAAEQLTVLEICDGNEFVNFYEENLARRKRINVYGSGMMRQLVDEIVKRKAGTLLGAYSDDGALGAAIAVVWDSSTMYYLLSSRKDNVHCGSISLLLWSAVRSARERRLIFDFDGIANHSILRFLSGFGGTLVQRLEVERVRADYAALRVMRRSAGAMSEAACRIWRWPIERAP